MGDSIVERFYVAGTYAITGLAAMTAPFSPEHRIVGRVFAASTLIGGMSWTFLSITLFYGHIGSFPFPGQGRAPPSHPRRGPGCAVRDRIRHGVCLASGIGPVCQHRTVRVLAS
jgi:hypothetical protein